MKYEKIFIKSESDLPAEGEYFCMLKNGTPAQCSFELIVVEWWMENVDWYFMEIIDRDDDIEADGYVFCGKCGAMKQI
jgi:hypothetical protein